YAEAVPDPPVSGEDVRLRNHSFQLAEIRAADHRHKLPAIYVTECHIQRVIGMQVRNPRAVNSRVQGKMTLPFPDHSLENFPVHGDPTIWLYVHEHDISRLRIHALNGT